MNNNRYPLIIQLRVGAREKGKGKLPGPNREKGKPPTAKREKGKGRPANIEIQFH